MDFHCLLLFSRDLVSSVATRFLAAVLINGRDIVSSVLLQVLLSRPRCLSFLLHSESRPRFFVKTPLLCCAAHHDLSFRLRPHFYFYCLRSRLRLPFSSRDLICGLLPSQVSNLSRDLKLMSRPLLMFISLLLVTTLIICCNQFLLSNLYARLRP